MGAKPYEKLSALEVNDSLCTHPKGPPMCWFRRANIFLSRRSLFGPRKKSRLSKSPSKTFLIAGVVGKYVKSAENANAMAVGRIPVAICRGIMGTAADPSSVTIYDDVFMIFHALRSESGESPCEQHRNVC